MKRALLPLLASVALLAPMAPAFAQKASNWRVFKIADGLPATAVISVSISPQGRILARALNHSMLSQLDGYTVRVYDAPAAGSGRVYESGGGRLWTVVPNGLQEFVATNWIFHPVAEIAQHFQNNSPDPVNPVPICPVRQSLLLLLLPDTLLEVNAENPNALETRVLLKAAATGLERFVSLSPGRDGSLWISGSRGLARAPGPLRNLKPDTQWEEHLTPDTLPVRNLREPLEDATGLVTALADSEDGNEKIMVHFDGRLWTSESAGNSRIRHAWIGPDKTRWALSADSLFRWEAGQSRHVAMEEYPARRYHDWVMEPGGTFWLATSDGLIRYSPPAWRAPPADAEAGVPGRCLTSDQEGKIWFVSGAKLHALDDSGHKDFPISGPQSPPIGTPRAIFTLSGGKILIDATEGLFEFNGTTGEITPLRADQPNQRFKPLGALNDGSLLLQTLNLSAEETNVLQSYDGSKLKPAGDIPPGMPAETVLLAAFESQSADLWLATDHGVAWRHEKKWKTFPIGDRSAPDAPVCFAEADRGNVWCATPDSIWEFDGKNWTELRRGFDGINAMLHARDGSLWIASNNGLMRYFQSGWIDNTTEDGLPDTSIRALCEDQRARIWVATAQGLSLFHPDSDRDPPRTAIQPLAEKDTFVPEGSSVVLTFSAVDKWKYTPRQRVLYSYRLDERDWSPFKEDNNVVFPELPAAKHYFQVRAMDRNGNIDPKPAQLEFAVVLPWFREARLVWILAVGLGAALFFAAIAFNRHRRLVRSYADVERKIAERTRELEIANRELLHSQKMNALGTLAAGIAHDFNNILSIIKGSAQIIEDNLSNPDKVRTRLDRIKTVVEQGTGIVKAMLGFSRDSDAQPSLCDLNSVVRDTVQLLGDRFLREVEVSFLPGTGLPDAIASRDLIQQILLNFIFNAAESMPGRKHVLIATAKLDALPEGLALAPARAGGYVSVSVKDSGCGIPPENLSRIFEPFFTTKALSARRGTGLGLSMAYEFAKKLQAGLAVESVVGAGSTFTLLLPAQVPAFQTAPPRSQSRATLQPK